MKNKITKSIEKIVDFSVEKIIVKEAIAQNSVAFSQLIFLYKKRIVAVGRRFFKNQNDIDDFLQEVFIKIYENLKNFQGNSKFSTWITRIAYNTAINFKTRTKKSESLCEETQANLVSIYETPEETQLKKITKEAINNAVKQLPENYEKCIELYFYNNMSYEEIAKTTDIPLNTVKTYIFRAKKELYQKLKEII